MFLNSAFVKYSTTSGNLSEWNKKIDKPAHSPCSYHVCLHNRNSDENVLDLCLYNYSIAIVTIILNMTTNAILIS